jgi:predicted phosphoadenosine phosphosulfate sulfurtransferase
MKDPMIIPLWFQIHGSLPTAINHTEYFLEPWSPNEKHRWIRSQKRISIKKVDWEVENKFSLVKDGLYGFYGLVKCMEQMFGDDNVAFLIGLRAEESLNRFRAVTKNPGVENISWSTKNKYNGIKFYPIYDWTFSDLWVYLSKNKIRYNKMYDYFFKKGYSVKDMRISSLMNHKAFQCLTDIQEFEPKLYDSLLDRCSGVKTASIYAKEDKIFKVNKLPDNFSSWLEYRDFLLKTLPNKDHVIEFKSRFDKQKQNDYVYKQQVYQLHIHDIKNHKKINNTEDPKIETRKKWMDLL